MFDHLRGFRATIAVLSDLRDERQQHDHHATYEPRGFSKGSGPLKRSYPKFRLVRCENGTAAVEFALIGLMMIIVTLGAIEFGRAIYLRNNLSYAADRAARLSLIDKTATMVQLEDEARTAFSGGDPAQLAVTFVSESIDGIPVLTISLGYTITLLIPNLTSQGVSMSISRRIPVL